MSSSYIRETYNFLNVAERMLRKKFLSGRNPECFILKTYMSICVQSCKKINKKIKKIIQIDSQNNAEIYKLKTQGDSSTWINVYKY